MAAIDNINHDYEIGLAQRWSFQEFMRQRPTSSKTIPIDVDNGGYKKKGTKILVLPQYTIAAKQVYEEFCDLTKRKTGNDHDMEMLDSDDATQVNANVKGHTDQLKAMFLRVTNSLILKRKFLLRTFVLRQAIATQATIETARVRRRSRRNPRDKNPLNARELIEIENKRIEMARYQRPVVNFMPPQQAVLLESRIVQWCREPAVPQLHQVRWEVVEAAIQIWQN